jgi:transposase
LSRADDVDLNPRAALGDKGYDSKSNRHAARQRGICPAIPYRSNTKDMPAFFPKTLYKARARIEQAVGKLKRFKRIALRCEKTAQNYGSFVMRRASSRVNRLAAERRPGSGDGRAMIYGKKGSEIKRFASDDSAAPSSRMVSSDITLIRSSMCSASASVFGFLASIYRAIVFKASIGLVI